MQPGFTRPQDPGKPLNTLSSPYPASRYSVPDHTWVLILISGFRADSEEMGETFERPDEWRGEETEHVSARIRFGSKQTPKHGPIRSGCQGGPRLVPSMGPYPNFRLTPPILPLHN